MFNLKHITVNHYCIYLITCKTPYPKVTMTCKYDTLHKNADELRYIFLVYVIIFLFLLKLNIIYFTVDPMFSNRITM